MGCWLHDGTKQLVKNVESPGEDRDMSVGVGDRCDCAMRGSPLLGPALVVAIRNCIL